MLMRLDAENVFGDRNCLADGVVWPGVVGLRGGDSVCEGGGGRRPRIASVGFGCQAAGSGAHYVDISYIAVTSGLVSVQVRSAFMREIITGVRGKAVVHTHGHAIPAPRISRVRSSFVRGIRDDKCTQTHSTQQHQHKRE